MASDADSPDTVDRSLSAVGVTRWIVVSDAGATGCGWLTVVDGSVVRRCTSQSTRGGVRWSSGPNVWLEQTVTWTQQAVAWTILHDHLAARRGLPELPLSLLHIYKTPRRPK